MANTKSASKRIQIAERNRLRNKAYKSTVKTMLKKTIVAISNLDTGNKELVQKSISITYSKIDKAVQKGILHSNNGNSKKALISRYLKKKLEGSGI